MENDVCSQCAYESITSIIHDSYFDDTSPFCQTARQVDNDALDATDIKSFGH